jgi:hypothetical protein
VEASDVVLVVLDGVEGDGVWEICEIALDAVLRADGHLVVFEVVVVYSFLKGSQEEIVRDEVLIGEPAGGDGFYAREVAEVEGVAARDDCERVVVELIVIAIVADVGGEERRQAEGRLPRLIKENLLCG